MRPFRLPHWSWLLLAGFVVFAAWAGVEGLRSHRMKSLFERLDSSVRVYKVREAPAWLDQLWPKRPWMTLFDYVDVTILSGTSPESAEDVANLFASSPRLRMVMFLHCGGLVRHIDSFSPLSGLDQLWVCDSVTENDLQKLRPLSRLRVLVISDSPIGDAALEPLGALTALETLEIENLQIHGAGLEHLASLPKLSELSITKCPLQAEQLSALAQLESLTKLNLDSTGVSNQAATPIAAMRQLKDLNLQGTKLNDEGLARIAGVRSLEKLDISVTNCTAEGVAAFQEARPDVEVRSNYSELLPRHASGVLLLR